MTGPATEDQLIAGRYRVDRRIGAGGMGAVYRALDQLIGEHVALKMLHTNDASHADRFVREVVLARKVTHKNVARTFDLGFHGESMFLTMELIEGATLGEKLRGGAALPLAEAASVLTQMSAGLAAAHEANVVHRDLKPGNVLVALDGRVVIIDFGIAGSATPCAAAEEVTGTLDFMAPEQLGGAAPIPATDVYALGLIAFLVLSGRLAFAGASPELRAIARLRERPPSLGERGDFPAELVGWVDAALALAPEARPTARELGELAAPLVNAAVPAPRRSFPGARLATAPTVAPARTIRVLPFVSDVPTIAKWDVGASIAEELADLLSRTRGVRVLASVLPSAAASVRAPGSENTGVTRVTPLEANFVVEGSVRELGSRLVVNARLVESATGAQPWSGRFEGSLGDVIEWGGQLAAQIAETLRLELDVRAAPAPVPDEVAELYLRGRKILRSAGTRPSEAVKILDRCIALAPDFVAAQAARAVAVARAYFYADFAAGDMAAESPRALGNALDVAPDSPDTQLALGTVALQQGRFATAVQALERVVEMAPTYALALEQLGRLEIEAGRNAAGMARLKLTAELDPMRRACLFPIARSHAFRGQVDAFDRIVRRIHEVGDEITTEEISLQIRLANWANDRARAECARAAIYPSVPAQLFDLSTRLILGEDVKEELEIAIEYYQSMAITPRIKALVHQVAAELFASRDVDLALRHLDLAATLPLVDIEWVELCPALDPLRESASFASLRAVVRRRISEMWAGTTQ